MFREKQLVLDELDRRYRITEHFLGDPSLGFSTGLLNVISGTGASVVRLAPILSIPGIARITCGTTSTGYASVHSPSNLLIGANNSANFNWLLRFKFRIPTIGDNTQTTQWILGFGNSIIAAIPTNGIYLSLNNSDNILYGVCSNNGANTSLAIGTLTANTWVKAYIQALNTGVVRIGCQLTSNGNFVEVLPASNIPSSNPIGQQYSVAKSLGTSNRAIELDYTDLFGFI
jgi:hypothetical protein